MLYEDLICLGVRYLVELPSSFGHKINFIMCKAGGKGVRE